LPLADAAAINKAIWAADVGAIASLRWVLPMAELIERLVLLPGPRAAVTSRRGTPSATRR
ncbi:MAG: hypothetical protein JNK82_42290, partial [Myxococcaceae bacterium]|nr:hypothetical protein [Myxococcaceae bacterium]